MVVEPRCRRGPNSVGATWCAGDWVTMAVWWHDRTCRSAGAWMVVGKAHCYKHAVPTGLRPDRPPPIPLQAPSPEPRSGFSKKAQGRLAGQAGASLPHPKDSSPSTHPMGLGKGLEFPLAPSDPRPYTHPDRLKYYDRP